MSQFEPEFVRERIQQINEWFAALLTISGITEHKTLQYFLEPMNQINPMQLEAEKFKTWMFCTRESTSFPSDSL